MREWARRAAEAFKAKPQPRMEPIDCSCGDFSVEVVGESNYQEALRKARLRAKATAESSETVALVYLLPEPNNQHDRNAVVVRLLDTGETVGYIPREQAPLYQRPLMDLRRKKGVQTVCRARFWGGDGAKPSIGIWLDYDLDRVYEALGS